MPTLGKPTICAYCGKEYIYGKGKTKTSKFCSELCYKEHNNKLYTSICKYCGKEFSRQRLSNGRLSRSDFCSKDCELEMYNQERKQEKRYRNCEQCGKVFELHRLENNKSKWSNERFCSDACFRQNYFDRTKNQFKQICKYCGKEFVRERYDNGRLSKSVYCSDSCAMKGQAEAYNKTCLEKYGVNYSCLLPQCQLAPKNNHQIVSKTNICFAEMLSRYNIDFEMEFNNNGKIANYFYDFYLPDYNLVVEINPTFSHSAKPNQLGWCVPDKEYHYNKTLLAKQNGYSCICIWDWDDEDAIVKAIKENKLQIIKGNIQKHWGKDKTNEHLFDAGFDEQQMIAEGWRPLYDDGQTLIY